jgi:alkylated DNA nucleotide flippase Atl1
VGDVLELVAAIPPAHVMTYGGVAAALGSRGARTVGQIMAYYGEQVPWWRVVRAGGHPPTGHEAIAREHYLEEGTPLVRVPTAGAYRIDMRAASWSPGAGL